jgi:hypothetical protein
MLRALAFLALIAAPLAPPPVAAGGLPEGAVRIELREGWRRADGSHVAALDIRLADGWRTYWRRPGSLGIAPRFDWSGSANVAGVRAEWPAPQVFARAGGQAIGYAGRLVLPLVIAPREPGRPIRLVGDLSFGACAEICLPLRLVVAAELRPGGARDAAILDALSRRSREVRVPARCALRPGPSGGLALALDLDLPRLGAGEAVAVEPADPSLWVTDARVARSGGRLRAEAEVLAARGGAVALDRSGIVITVIGGGRAVHRVGCDG